MQPHAFANQKRVAVGARGRTNWVPLVLIYLDHDVAGIRLPFDDPLLVVADLGDLLGRHHDPAEDRAQAPGS